MSIPYYQSLVKEKEFVYLLGFLWADGYISKVCNSIEINIVKEDYEVLSPVFSKHIKWNIFQKQRKQNGIPYGRPQIKSQISLSLLKQFLLEYGYANKSGGSPALILSIIPPSLRYFWWRGYFDGDGSIAISKNGCKNLAFWSTADQDWSELDSVLKSLGVKFSIYKYYRKCGNSSALTLTHTKRIRSVRSFLYPRNEYDFGLKRKFDKLMLV